MANDIAVTMRLDSQGYITNMSAVIAETNEFGKTSRQVNQESRAFERALQTQNQAIARAAKERQQLQQMTSSSQVRSSLSSQKEELQILRQQKQVTDQAIAAAERKQKEFGETVQLQRTINTLTEQQLQLQREIQTRQNFLNQTYQRGNQILSSRGAEQSAFNRSGLSPATLSRYAGNVKTIGVNANRTAQSMTQLGFAVEDATVSFGINGLQGAMRGATNNLTAMAAMTGQVHALFGIIAVNMAVQGLSAWNKYRNGIKDAQEQLQSFRDELQRTMDLIEEDHQRKNRLRDARTADGASSEIQSIQDEIAAIRDKESALEEMFDSEYARLQELKSQRELATEVEAGDMLDVLGLNRAPGALFDLTENIDVFGLTNYAEDLEATRKKLKEIETEWKGIADDRRKMESDLSKLQEKRNGLLQHEANLQKHAEDSKRIQAEITRYEAEQEERRQRAQRGRDLRTELRRELDPDQVRRDEILNEQSRRVQEVRGLELPPEEAESLISMIMESTRKKLAELDERSKLDRKEETMGAPSGIRRGSQEAFEKIREFQNGNQSYQSQSLDLARKHLQEAKKAAQALEELDIQESQGFEEGAFS